VLLAILLAACATTGERDEEADLILTGSRSFVSAAYHEGLRCGYRQIVRKVHSKAEKVAESDLDRRSHQAECFGEWIAKIPDATFELLAPETVY
jgi:hypothetical protein